MASWEIIVRHKLPGLAFCTWSGGFFRLTPTIVQINRIITFKQKSNANNGREILAALIAITSLQGSVIDRNTSAII